MFKKIKTSKSIFSMIVVCILLLGAFLPIGQAEDLEHVKGFEKGPSYKPVVPMKRTTFVNFDENNFLDDFAYLAAVPTSVFNYENKLFSNPLLFYQDIHRFVANRCDTWTMAC